MKKLSEPVVLGVLCFFAVLVICIAGMAYEYGWFGSGTMEVSSQSLIQTPVSSVTSTLGFVDVNIATVYQLEQIPGLDHATAMKIVTYREANGPFSHLSQLQEIPGVEKDTIIEIIPFLICE